MPPRAIFDVLGETQFGSKIADVEKVIRFRNAEGGMMQPRPSAGRKDDVVRITLALQEYEKGLVAAITSGTKIWK